MTDQVVITMLALERVTERLVKQVTLDATANLSSKPPLGTPIDTGWARNNWIPNIGSPVQEAVGSEDNPASAAAAQQQGITSVLTSYKLNRGSIFISNNVPYIGRLNDGHSRQSPRNFIQSAILTAVQSAK